ncbi:dehydrodolichyl diphosphate synthase-like [Sarcoptes scabiei]|nr:dehydrodolichyl diphosphate synthase-like [Sarcoptes scabiei]
MMISSPSFLTLSSSKVSSITTKSTQTKNFLLSIVSIGLFVLSCCQGSHYTKYHISDFCTEISSNRVIELRPNSNMTAIMIKLKRESYRPRMNCTIRLTTMPGFGLMAFVTKLKLRRYNSLSDYIEFVSNNQSLIKFLGNNQEIVPKKTILTNSVQNVMMIIRFVSDSFHYSLQGKGFKIVVNLYSPIINQECDKELGLNLNCQNKFCIDDLLECDGIDNCRNDFDEIQCGENSETKLSLYVFLSTLAVMFFLMIMFLMKNKDRRKDIVRKMSHVYANNHPILYVMENHNGSTTTSSSSSSTERCSSHSPTESSSNSTSSNLDNINGVKRKSPLSLIHNNLSLSLPSGIEISHSNHKPRLI